MAIIFFSFTFKYNMGTGRVMVFLFTNNAGNFSDPIVYRMPDRLPIKSVLVGSNKRLEFAISSASW